MVLRILDGGRPGQAILEFDKAIEAPELDISVRSMTSRPGLYLTLDGLWEKTPSYFKATRLSGDRRTSRYLVGRDVVNHMVDQDTVQVAISQTGDTLDTIWENATPELGGAARTGRIYSAGRDRPRTVASAAAPIAAVSEEALAAPIPAAIPVDQTPVMPPEVVPQPPKRISWLRRILLAALVIWLLSVAAMLIWPELRCQAYDGALGGCEDKTSILACVADKITSNPCQAEQCLQGQNIETWPTEMREKLRVVLAQAKAMCQEGAKADDADAATACVERKEKANEFCQLRECLTLLPAGSGDAVKRAELEARVRAGEQRCAAEKEKVENEKRENEKVESEKAAAREKTAEDTTRACILKHEQSGGICDVSADCLDPYLKENPKGAAAADLTRLAEEARKKCLENKDFTRLESCANQRRAAGQPCDIAAQCIEPYLRNHSSASETARAAQLAEQAKQECEKSKNDVIRANSARFDDQFWAVAKACAANSAAATGATGCNVKACYQAYMSKFPEGRHVSEAKTAMDATRCDTPARQPQPQAQPQPQQTGLPNGVYNYRVSTVCGQDQPRASLQVTVRDGQLSWVHTPGIGPAQPWEGRLGNNDQLSATATGLGYAANGTSNNFTMRYPNCDLSMTREGRIN